MNETSETKKLLTIFDETGKETQVELLVAFRMETTGMEYVVYTMNEKDENGNVTIYASSLVEIEGKKALAGINTDEEWEKIKEVIRELAKAE